MDISLNIEQKVFANWLVLGALLQYLSKLFRSLSFYLAACAEPKGQPKAKA